MESHASWISSKSENSRHSKDVVGASPIWRFILHNKSHMRCLRIYFLSLKNGNVYLLVRFKKVLRVIYAMEVIRAVTYAQNSRPHSAPRTTLSSAKANKSSNINSTCHQFLNTLCRLPSLLFVCK